MRNARDVRMSSRPPKHIATPESMACTALFLASDEARFINAPDIPIDGGRF